MLILFIIVILIIALVKGTISRFIESVKDRKKYIKAGALIALIPLIALTIFVILIGVEPSVAIIAILFPFFVPALLSGAFVGYLIGALLVKPKISRLSSTPYRSQYAPYTPYNPWDNHNDPNIIDTTGRYIDEDPYGRAKDLMWRANNPQPKDLPAIRY